MCILDVGAFARQLVEAFRCVCAIIVWVDAHCAPDLAHAMYSTVYLIGAVARQKNRCARAPEIGASARQLSRCGVAPGRCACAP